MSDDDRTPTIVGTIKCAGCGADLPIAMEALNPGENAYILLDPTEIEAHSLACPGATHEGARP